MFQKMTLAIAAVLFVCGSSAIADEMEPGAIFSDCDGCPEMVVVPAGTFMMGTPRGEIGGDRYERPVHEVSIGYDFAVGRFEISVAEFRRFMEATDHAMIGTCASGSTTPFFGNANGGPPRGALTWQTPGYDQEENFPVSCIGWDDTQSYLEWLSTETGQSYRLLTEAEWEYAARAGTNTKYYGGDRFRHSFANYVGTGMNDPWTYMAPVGIYEPNAFGLYDMHGNSWEWVQDCRESRETYEDAPDDGSAREEGHCHYRVLRSGSWFNGPQDMRSGNRTMGETRLSSGADGRGFRVARDLRPSDEVPGAE